MPGDKHAVEYDFACTEDLKAFTIISNRALHYFEPEVQVFDAGTGAPAGLLMFCEGAVPGPGFACSFRSSSGYAPANFRIRGELSPQKDPCASSKKAKGKGRASKKSGSPWRLQLVVATVQGTLTGGTFTTTSDPFVIPTTPCGKS